MKKIIIIFIILTVSIIIFYIINRYGITTVENFNGNIEKVTFLKTQNKNTSFNFVKPNVNSLNISDLILYKNPLIFDDDFSEKENILGRIIGLPGDNVKIENSQVYINNVLHDPNYELYFLYRITMSDTTDFDAILQQFDLKIEKIINDFACDFTATQSVADEVAKIDNAVNLRKILKNKNKYSYDIFPFNPRIFWDSDNFGPILIPQKGTTIALNPNNYFIYKIIMDTYEDNIVIFDNAKFEINGIKTEEYTFKKNYYFVLNDNRYSTKDSRTFGLIPEDQILGKIIY